jgi:hypothetical protein
MGGKNKNKFYFMMCWNKNFQEISYSVMIVITKFFYMIVKSIVKGIEFKLPMLTKT